VVSRLVKIVVPSASRILTWVSGREAIVVRWKKVRSLAKASAAPAVCLNTCKGLLLEVRLTTARTSTIISPQGVMRMRPKVSVLCRGWI
jgi:hypothetical protein